MHDCPGLGGLLAPMVEVKHLDDRPDAIHVLTEREDFTHGNPDVPRIMNTTTRHGDGRQDCTVYAPVARADLRAYDPVHGTVASAGVARVHSQAPDVRFRHQFRDPSLEPVGRLARKLGATMVFGTNSKVMAYTLREALANKTIALQGDTLKLALFGNGGTPDQTVATAALAGYLGAGSAWVTGNEVSGANYTAGGITLTGVTCAQAAGVITLDSTLDCAWTAATIDTWGGLVWDDTHANDLGVAFLAFGGEQKTTVGNFTVQFNASGIATYSV
jgi:hypothetical protein